MAIEIFPAYAKLLVKGLRHQPVPKVNSDDMEAGPAEQEMVESRQTVRWNCSYHFSSKADYLSFDTWFKTNINNGTAWFTWTNPLTDTAVVARIIAGSYQGGTPLNKGLTKWDAQMVIGHYG